MFRGKTALQQTQNLNQINTQTLASGIYFLQATSNNKTYQTKFIKQ
ncbi:MAG: T9SS type A sorting domain-containing protein [Flavobacterium sp.]|nr:T9SS type A sorting domain-containing protein [Flavobacterium sp.]